MNQITLFGSSEHTITVQDITDTDDFVFWGEPYQQMIDGSLSHNLRGKRRKVFVGYQRSLTPSDFASMVNDVITEFENAGYIRAVIGGFSERFVLSDSFLYKAKYNNQRGIFTPVLELQGQQLGSVAVVFLDWGLITDTATENIDYGLISQLVTVQEDYGAL
tara:strand:+ start:2199 stop:2684 length:486 start_codon:yes stop_codon:yes gene_type:complete